VKKLVPVFKRVRLTFYTFGLFELHEIEYPCSDLIVNPIFNIHWGKDLKEEVREKNERFIFGT
jgi:hypothetical protein